MTASQALGMTASSVFDHMIQIYEGKHALDAAVDTVELAITDNRLPTLGDI